VVMVHDGRWTFPPSPVEWVTMPRFARPLGVRRDPTTGLTAVIMSPPRDCFAVLTPHQTESHCSMYLSLIGRDLKPDETAHAHTRLLIATNMSDAEIVEAYSDYLKQLASN